MGHTGRSHQPWLKVSALLWAWVTVPFCLLTCTPHSVACFWARPWTSAHSRRAEARRVPWLAACSAAQGSSGHLWQQELETGAETQAAQVGLRGTTWFPQGLLRRPHPLQVRSITWQPTRQSQTPWTQARKFPSERRMLGAVEMTHAGSGCLSVNVRWLSMER